MYDTQIYELLSDSIKHKATAGISYSIEGQTIHQEHYLGFKTYQNKEVIDENSIYDIASLTKIVATTTRILQLIDHKKISLNDRIQTYFPAFKYKDVTIKNLLLHNSGLPADLNNVMAYPDKDSVINAIFDTKLVYPTGENMIYSDLNFILLGMLIEKMDNMGLAESVQKHVLLPLGMQNSGYNLCTNLKDFVPTEKTSSRGLIRGQVHDETAYKLNGVSGNAGLFSTMKDLNHFCQMYLNLGSYQGDQILSSKIIKDLFDFNFKGRTLGWQRWNKNDHTLWHTGFTGTSLAIDMDKQRYFVCLTNRVCPSRQNKKWLSIRRLAIGLFFQEPELL